MTGEKGEGGAAAAAAEASPQQGRQSAAPVPIVAKVVDPLPINSARLCAAAVVPHSSELVALVGANRIVLGDQSIAAPANVRAIATARYVAVPDGGLPTSCTVLVALLEGVGVALYTLPELTRVGEGEGDSEGDSEGGGALDEALRAVTKEARHLAVDQQSGKSTATDSSFRIAVGTADNVALLLVNVPKGTVEVLSEAAVSEPLVSLAFADMTMVATTARNHCMLRIARSSNMAVAATVLRYDPQLRRRKGAPGDPGAAVMSFFGGLFAKKGGVASGGKALAFPLPDNRWVLSVDDEWVTYSAFGAKLEDMENVFKSRAAIDIPESEINAALSAVDNKSQSTHDISVAGSTPGLRRTPSVSSMASMTSVTSAFTAHTLVDEARASRSDKPAAVAAYASPFVLCVNEKNELLAFAANGSIPGAIATLPLGQEGDATDGGASIVPCMHELCLAVVYWASGRVVEIHLAKELSKLIEECEAVGELRNALALVPIEQVDRTISFRRKLAVEARQADWHDASIHHMQQVVNLCVARDGVGQLDLIVEAIELRGPRGSSWEADPIVATLWADFLFRLRRRLMQPSASDIDVLQTLCRADAMSTRIKALFSVKHDVPMEAGEAAITAGDCALREDERIEALVALYMSLDEHDKALVLLENSRINGAFQTVCSFLRKSIRPDENPAVFFKHLSWVAAEAKESNSRESELTSLVAMTVDLAKECDDPIAEEMLQGVMRITVEHSPHMLDSVIELICPWDDCVEEKKEEPVAESGVRTSWLGRRVLGDKQKTEDEVGSPIEPEPEKEASVEEEGEEPDDKVEPEGEEDPPKPETARIAVDLFAIALLAGMAKADLLQNEEVFEKLRGLLQSRVLHNEDAGYNAERLVVALQADQYKAMSLHEELAFLLGRQGQHEAAALELAAETSLNTVEAKRRLEKLLPASERGMSNNALVSAYLQVSGGGRPSRVDCAAEVVRREGGFVDVEKVLRDLRENSAGALTLAEMRLFLRAALISGKERGRLAEIVKAMRMSEARRVRDEVLRCRRRCVLIGDERACSICTRRIDESSVFAVYPNDTVTHLACHNVAMSSNRSHSSAPSGRTE